ncbi:hypothetical protein JIG36_51295 [Actinoplanes sp. LDG1-06]|uniref:Uncharacterized protein n=1 Tax=Paractinoplanes ovalisporus TaxID=2810368 RepID=A0ABS2AVN1_9ACTN|nr:hypothetical protein [Actinoplanes ovalisporus]MBM2623904.1 hypothetical protein [Actinoplanes ovalisporus]
MSYGGRIAIVLLALADIAVHAGLGARFLQATRLPGSRALWRSSIHTPGFLYWGVPAAYGVGGVFVAASAALAAPSWLTVAAALLISPALAWLFHRTVDGELRHLRAYEATRTLVTTAESLAKQHGGNVAGVRRISGSVLTSEPPTAPTDPWHSRRSWWVKPLLDIVPADINPAGHDRLDRALAGFDRAQARFNEHRR